MQRSKYLALLLLVSTATAGYAVGFTSERVMGRQRMQECRRNGDPRAMRARLGEELALSPEQRAQLDRILEERHRQMTVAMAPVRPQMDSISAAARGQIRLMLAPEQQARFDRFHQETSARRSRGPR